MQTSTDAEAYAERMTRAGERYTACVAAEAEKDVANPAGVEDIAVAAHGRCWAHWDAYREATNSTYLASATTREEMQLAHDRADAHLRQFERDTRRSVMDGLVERTFARTKPP
jgi:hypothetical protein